MEVFPSLNSEIRNWSNNLNESNELEETEGIIGDSDQPFGRNKFVIPELDVVVPKLAN